MQEAADELIATMTYKQMRNRFRRHLHNHNFDVDEIPEELLWCAARRAI
jgi:hypothetical protein